MEEITPSLIERRVNDLSTSSRTGVCVDFHAGIMKPFDIVRVLWKKYKVSLIEIEIITNVQRLIVLVWLVFLGFGFFVCLTRETLTWFAVIWTSRPSIAVRPGWQQTWFRVSVQ